MTDSNDKAIEITTGHCLGGEGNDVYQGKILIVPRDLSFEAADAKVRAGYARYVPGPQESGLGPPPVPGPDSVIHGDPEITNRDPNVEAPMARRGRRGPAGG